MHQPAESFALLPQPPVVGDEARLGGELPGGEAPAAELREPRPEHAARVAALDDERGDALRARAGLHRRKDDARLGDRRVADELLPPVDYVAAVDSARAGLDRGGV